MKKQYFSCLLHYISSVQTHQNKRKSQLVAHGTSALPITGQKFPRHTSRDIWNFVAVFQIFLNIDPIISHGKSTDETLVQNIVGSLI
jgi:hypothetical protein